MLFFPPRQSFIASRFAVCVLALLLGWPATRASASSDEPWPREFLNGPLAITLQTPDYTAWDYLRLTMEMPVRIARSGEAPIYATATVVARTYADRPRQRILLREFSVLGLIVSSETERSATGDAAPDELARQVQKALTSASLEVNLNTVVAAFAGKKRLPSVAIASESPRVFASRGPAILLQFDGPPMWLPVDGTKLSMGVNTNWDIFYDNKSTFYYLLAGDLWLATHDIYAGEWVIPKSLPNEVRQIPQSPDFAMVWKNLPYKPDPGRAIPEVFFSEQAAELLLLDGDPILEPIAGTDLAWVSNTDSDLFFHYGEKRFYLAIAGRWFTAANPEDYWRTVADLPSDFARIPEDHARGRVLVHVPGTRLADHESLWAQVPQLAKIRRSEASIQIAFAGKPQYVPIDGTSLLWVPNATLPVVSHAGTLYACHHAVWFRADTPEGPWMVADSIPQEIYTIPPRSAAFHLSFVRLVESDADTVTFGYTAGYKNTFVHNGAVVYGTGYGHAPALQYGAYTYPVYFAQPATFGAGAWYSPKDHVFLRGRPGYGPYGGFGASSRYNATTSHYFRPLGLYGIDYVDKPELAFHPYTFIYGKVSVTYEPYSVLGKAVLPWGSAADTAFKQAEPAAVPGRRASKDQGAAITIQVGEPVLSAPGTAPFQSGRPLSPKEKP